MICRRCGRRARVRSGRVRLTLGWMSFSVESMPVLVCSACGQVVAVWKLEVEIDGEQGTARRVA